ncbi:MAG: hypothetical protein D8M58_11250 [Calditrichaeota bacterium]|nr:MAG: hypothetical protein DWQ03_10625 [Calditrichota bacterium]MBL1205969.1 hypothetical protein [Calditrichota bacterium]NOG45797.1 hypothetical protein [Calditrichota bacterium]
MQIENQIIKQLFQYGKKEKAYHLAGKISRFFLLFFILWLSVSLADSALYFSKITRWGLFLLNIPIVLFLIFKLIINPFREWNSLKQNSDLSSIAIDIGKKNPAIADRLVNIYQLSQKKSSQIIDAAIDQWSSEIEADPFINKLSIKDNLPSIKLIIPVFISALILMSFQWANLANSTLRLLNPTNNYLKIPPYSFNVFPGNKDVLYKQPLEIKVGYQGPQAKNVELFIFYDGNENQQRKMILEKRKDHYVARLKEITSPFSYTFSAIPLRGNDLEGSINSETYQIGVLVPPLVKELSVKTTPPAYSKTEPFLNDTNDGNISCLAGSGLQFKITSNKVLKNAFITFNDTDTLHLQTKGKLATTEFSVKKNGKYKISLVDVEGLVNSNPITYTISLLPDNAPYVDIVEPGEDIEAQLEDIMGFKVDASDDYGLSNVYLNYRYIKKGNSTDSLWHRFKLKDFRANKTQLEIHDYFDFNTMYVGYDDELEYFAVALDNNSVNGYSKSVSPVYRVRFPSINELFEEFAGREEEKVDELETMAEESEELRQKLDEINRELKRSEELDWDLKKQIENSLDEQKSAQEKIEKIQQELQEMIEKLDKNSLMNPEIMEKYSQLQNLFQEIATPELLEAMKKLEQAMEKSNQKDVQKALENFKQNQEAFQANLERTLELFKQVQLEQQMDQLVQQAERLADNQQKMSEAMKEPDSLSDENREQLKTDQNQQNELLSSLERNLENMLKKDQLNKFQEARENLEKANNEIGDQKLKEQLAQLKQDLKNQQMEQAGNQSQKLQKSFQQMQQDLNQAMQSLKRQNKQNVQKKMAAATQKMLKLSHEQEKIQRATKNASQINEDLKQMARKQAHLQENLGKLLSDIIQLSKETFFINPELSKNMANAYSNMQRSLDDLSERRNAQAAGDQQRAMTALNRGLGSMQKSMQQMSGSQSGTGFEQFMEQLQQMAGQQGGLNNETLNFMEGEGNQGQMSMKQQAGSKRLAAQQKAIQQAMQEMAEKMGNRSDMLGRLNEMGEQMDEIVQDMLANNVNRKTIDRQQQILSRMLDAQKSVREREFSKKRKAEQAKKYFAKDPGKIKDSENLTLKQLQDALKKAMSEGYHSDYQKLIEAYFKELSAQQGKN